MGSEVGSRRFGVTGSCRGAGVGSWKGLLEICGRNLHTSTEFMRPGRAADNPVEKGGGGGAAAAAAELSWAPDEWLRKRHASWDYGFQNLRGR